MCGNLEEFVFEPLLERDGVKVSRSPWGPDDQIGRLNWITPESTAAILGSLDGRHVFDLSVDFFKGMPSWVAAGDPVYDIWMTHTPDGSVIDGLAGVPPHQLEKYSYAGDAFQMYVHCGTHLDTLNHFGHSGRSGTAGTRSSTSAAATGSWAARSTSRRSSRGPSCSTSPACTASTA